MAQRSDEQIQAEVAEHLRQDGRVELERVEVRVHQGVVELSGHVPSVMAHQAATEVAQAVPGVRDVANRLAVVYTAAKAAPTDQELQAAAQDVLRSNGQIDAARIGVRASKGVIVLQGSVESYWQRTLADQAVRAVEGVRQVLNELAVVSGQATEDLRIARDILLALRRSALVEVEDVRVKVKDGRVILSGTLPHWQALRAVEEAAWRTPGVREVVSNLRVAP